MSSGFRKWFMNQHDKGNGGSNSSASLKISQNVTEKLVKADEGNSQRRETRKYFSASSDITKISKLVIKEEIATEKAPPKRKGQKSDDRARNEFKPSSAKRFRKGDNDDDSDFAPSPRKKMSADTKALKNKNSSSGTVPTKRLFDGDESEGHNDKGVGAPREGGGRGRGWRGRGRRGRGRRGGFMSFGERKDPPHKREKEVSEGVSDCLAGLTVVISDSSESEDAEDLIKRCGSRFTRSVNKKTNYLLADEDIDGNKSKNAKDLCTTFLKEDGLFDMIHKSKPKKAEIQKDIKNKTPKRKDTLLEKVSHMKYDLKAREPFEKIFYACLSDSQAGSETKIAAKDVLSSGTSQMEKNKTGDSLTWTVKYCPKVPNDIIGNQSHVKQLHDWLANWRKVFLPHAQKATGKKQNDSAAKKAVLISGSPGIGKSISAKLVSRMLGFHYFEVNACDKCVESASKILRLVGANISDSIEQLIGTVINYKLLHPKSVLILNEVDGMPAGGGWGVADLIDSIKFFNIPIICICDDGYSEELKNLLNYCLPINFRKPTKQQMAKRLMLVAQAEGLHVNEITLEELSERVHGDMRMALNQLQFMSLTQSVIKYDDVRDGLLSSAKDEDISPFTAVDKLFDFNGGRLRMDERIDLSMSDPDLVPLIIQENYINYRPSSVGKDDNGVKRMNMIAQVAESIADGDIVNAQIRRYQQWQLSQAGSFASSIIPTALMHGNRETLKPGEQNCNRFSCWLGNNLSTGENLRLLEDVHIHILASQASRADRQTLRVDYLSLLLKKLTDPLRVMPKEAAVQAVVEFMNTYSLSQMDMDTILKLSKFQSHPNPIDGIQRAVEAVLAKAYKQGSTLGIVRTNLPGIKKVPKKRVAAILEPVEEENLDEENDDAILKNGEGSDSEETDVANQNDETRPHLDLQTDKLKGIVVKLELKSDEGGMARKKYAAKAIGSRSSGKRGRGGSSSGKRKR